MTHDWDANRHTELDRDWRQVGADTAGEDRAPILNATVQWAVVGHWDTANLATPLPATTTPERSTP